MLDMARAAVVVAVPGFEMSPTEAKTVSMTLEAAEAGSGEVQLAEAGLGEVPLVPNCAWHAWLMTYW